jgi:hypothetical protein
MIACADSCVLGAVGSPQPRSMNWLMPWFAGPGHGVGQEFAVLDRQFRDERDEGEQPVRELTVGREIILAAEDIIIDAGDARSIRIELGHSAN